MSKDNITDQSPKNQIMDRINGSRYIKISSPASGSIYSQSGHATVKLEFLAFGGVIPINPVFIVNGIGYFAAPNTPPYSVSFSLPLNTPIGNIGVELIARDSLGIIYADTSYIIINPSGTLDSIVVYPSNINLDTLDRTQSVTVQGYFNTAQGIMFENLTDGSTGTSYSSQKSGTIFTVDENGLTTAVKPGTDSLIINYGGKTLAVPVTVSNNFGSRTMLSNTIDFPPVGNRFLGDDPFGLSASATSGEEVIFSIISGPATIQNGILTITGIGIVTVKASQNGDAYFAPASDVTQSFTVTLMSAPTITSFGPASAITGTSVNITGTNFTDIASVSFGGVPATSFDVVSSTSITAVVGAGASGDVSVSTSHGTGTLAGFNFVFSLPPANFKVLASSATCKGSTNGAIRIIAAQNLNYTAVVTSNNLNASYPFTDTVTINNLAAGTYHVCITVQGQAGYEQCYDMVVSEPKDLSVFIAVNRSLHSITLNLDGGSTYHIQLGGKLYSTSGDTITLPLTNRNNLLTVTTDRKCQGIVQKLINVSDKPKVYPNPFDNMLNIDFGVRNVSKAVLNVINMCGKLIYTKQFANQSGAVQLDMSNLVDGAYVLKLNLDNSRFIFKIIKVGK